MKLAVVAMLAVGIIVVAPDLKMPAFTPFIHGGGPIIPGTLFPYLFITIACGAVSGFHALVSSGTTPKMITSEAHILPIAGGAMLAEGLVSILALLAATSLLPLDYFQINVDPVKFQKFLPQFHAMGFTDSNLAALSADVGEKVAGRPGGAVSLAVGMAQIFSGLPGLKSLMAYWYHFAIMFEALFILTTIDAGTRIARFILQEAGGKIYAPFGRTNSLPGNLAASFLVVAAWGGLLYTGNISTIWPMFGAANQLLATIALAVGTSFIINRGRARYAWVTAVPLLFVGATTLTAAITNMTGIYWPQAAGDDASVRLQGLVNLLLMGFIVLAVVLILVDAASHWLRVLRRSPIPAVIVSSEKP
jgi:carbon starvation protein